MKIGMKLILIITAVNLAGVGGLTITASVIASNGITAISEENARNVTAVSAGSVKAYLEVPFDEIRGYVYLLENMDTIVPAEERRDMAVSLSAESSIVMPNFSVMDLK